MNRKLHRHDLSMDHLFSGNMGKLIPTHWRFCYPGDQVRQRSHFLVRVSPMLAPIYSKVLIKCESFFVPTDNVWVNAGEFYSRGQSGTSTKTIPKFNISGTPAPNTGQGTLLDYLGYAQSPLTLNVNALPPRVYNAIFNWHYRDQDIVTPRVYSTADGPDTTTDLTLASRPWMHDRFNTARSEPQRGDDVLIPGGPGELVDPDIVTNNLNPTMNHGAATNTSLVGTNSGSNRMTALGGFASTDLPIKWGNETGMQLADDEVNINSGTIRELEEAVAINRFRKRLQQADGSYPDYTLATFGIRAPDIELQKPVLLARSSSPLQVSEVLQTAQAYDSSDDPIGDPVGDYKGHGIAVHSSHGFKYKVKRHGYIMTIFSVVPVPSYDFGVDKEWRRTTADDYFDPDLDQIGEEEIMTEEVNGSPDEANTPFGYQYRNYCDRSSLDKISGEFHNELDFFTQTRKFIGTPALNSAFITCDPSDRIFALGSTVDQLRVKAMHDVKMLRVMRRIPNRGIL